MTDRSVHEEQIAEHAFVVLDTVGNTVISHITTLRVELDRLESMTTESMAHAKASVQRSVHVAACALQNVERIKQEIADYREQLATVQPNGNGEVHADEPRDVVLPPVRRRKPANRTPAAGDRGGEPAQAQALETKAAAPANGSAADPRPAPGASAPAADRIREPMERDY